MAIINEDVKQAQPVNPISNTGAQPFTNTNSQQRPRISQVFGGLGAISVDRGHQDMLAIREAIEKQIEGVKEYKFHFLPVPDNSDLSGFVLVGHYTDHPETVAYQTVLIEGTARVGEINRPFTITVNGNQQVPVTRLPSDYANEVLIASVKQKVRDAFPSSSVLPAAVIVVPSKFNVKDEGVVRTLTENITAAVVTELATRTGVHTPVNLAKLSLTSGMIVEQSYGNNTLKGVDGLPIRSSVLVEMLYQSRGDNRTLNRADNTVNISRCSAFVDALFNPAPGYRQQNSWMPVQNNQGSPSQCFSPRCVVTDIVTEARTTDRLLLALASIFTVREKNYWMQAFKPVSGQAGRVNLSNIAALNIDANLSQEPRYGSIIKPENGVDFSLTEIGTMLQMMFRQELIFSLDVPDAGAQTWYLQIFSEAARGNNDCYNEIYQAANCLTGGAFEKYFAQGTPIFIPANDRIHLGYWTDSQGIERDIRDFDHTAVANIVGVNNPELLREWGQTWCQLDVDPYIRLEKRKPMIQAMSSDTAVFTGYGWRHTFSGAFVLAFSKAMYETRMAVDIRTPLSGSDFDAQRAAATWADAALVGTGMGSMFQQPALGGNNFGGSMGFMSGRWG